MTKAAKRFLAEVSAGAWSDDPEPWENTARLGLSPEDSAVVSSYAADAGEDSNQAANEVVAACAAKVLP